MGETEGKPFVDLQLDRPMVDINPSPYCPDPPLGPNSSISYNDRDG
jgi:hypothetical protein